jgi:predicted HTH transcriptional regulator
LEEVQQRFPSALELQCIPEDRSLWEIENYEAFLRARRKMLAEHLNAFLGGITDINRTAIPASIEDLMNEGESDELEYKSTLRWDIRLGCANKLMEEAIVKAVAAFANSQGGTLLIGVNDDGEAVGLESDYSTLKSEDRDGFELHLRNMLNQHVGKGFVSTKVKVRFHVIDQHDVCQVDVDPANEPIVVAFKGKDGVTNERLYVRNGNASQDIGMKEMPAYIKERFG